MPIASPGAGDVPRSHRNRLDRLERRIKRGSDRKPVKPFKHIDFGVSGPVVIGATSSWPAPDNFLTVGVVATLRTYTSGTVTALLKKTTGGTTTTLLTISLTAAGTFPYPLSARGTKDSDVFWLDVTGAGTGAAYLDVQMRYR